MDEVARIGDRRGASDASETFPALPGQPPGRLKRRADFLAVSRGIRVHHTAFTIQAGRRGLSGSIEAGPPARIGLTVTKKVGTAAERNRIRRRLREALRHAKALSTEPETDYVIVARRDVLALPFFRLVAGLEASVRRAGGKIGARPPASTRRTDDV